MALNGISQGIESMNSNLDLGIILAEDTLFVDAQNRNLRLLIGSPIIYINDSMTILEYQTN
jgi:hypothetical protein